MSYKIISIHRQERNDKQEHTVNYRGEFEYVNWCHNLRSILPYLDCHLNCGRKQVITDVTKEYLSLRWKRS